MEKMGQVTLIVIFGLIAMTNSASIPSSHTCGCSREYLPVCGSDDVTYGNRCLFMCEKEVKNGLKIKNEGVCVPNEVNQEPEPCMCLLIYAPICGSDGIIYASECHLKCAQKQKGDLKPKHDGECGDEEFGRICACPLNYEPLCGSDGQTYGNRCNFNCEKLIAKNPLEIAHIGECESKIEHLPIQEEAEEEEISCACEYLYDPICGSDGKTYDNICELECMRSKDGSIRIDHRGAC